MKGYRYLLTSLLLCTSTFYGADAPAEQKADSAAVSSSNASYDGNALLLTGHVLLDHGLGKLAADEAKLQKQEVGKEFPFSLIQLMNHVKLSMKTGAQIQCDGADLDFTSLKGQLTALEGNKVVYSDALKKGLFRLLGNSVDLKIAKREDQDKKASFDIETILAKDEVSIEFAGDFSLQAHQALYRKMPTKEGSSQEFQGIVTAYPKDAENPCRLVHGDDLVLAESVDLDIVNSKLTLLHPKGSVTSHTGANGKKGAIKFTCDHLLWDHLKNTLTLKGHVNVLESLFGRLTSDGDLEIVQTQQKQNRVLKSIRATGVTEVDFKDENETSHHLRGYGPFTFDRQQLRATLESPKRKPGKDGKGGGVPLDKQVHYEMQSKTSGLSLFANHAQMEYTPSQGNLRPSVLTLTGNIRLFSMDEKKPRYALADRLTLSNTTRTIILSAAPGRKVLFMDKSQTMKIAAQEVHITRDSKTGEERVQGIGNVQFAFSDEESKLMKKLFPANE
ncbi:MAG: hypothetical protein HYX48_03380 [Chlamydiales bacterium]|nr:hypothetical protein [Chlamydiales bacterium]